jgi:hypothetical protein
VVDHMLCCQMLAKHWWCTFAKAAASVRLGGSSCGCGHRIPASRALPPLATLCGGR